MYPDCVRGEAVFIRGLWIRMGYLFKAMVMTMAIGSALSFETLQAQELDFEIERPLSMTQGISVLDEVSRKLSSLDQTVRELEPSTGVTRFKTKPEKIELGKLPLPTAKVSPQDFSKLAIQIQKLGDLGGTPYGSNFGKATFGKTGSDLTFQGLVQEREPVSIEPAAPLEDLSFPNPEEMSPEQLLVLNGQLAELEKEMNQLAKKDGPFEGNDYKSYEKAKELFKKNDKLISKLNEFDESFVQNAKELFVKHSWRDMDKVGKRPYERFMDRQGSERVFPYPRGQEPTPKIHQGGISH